MAWNMMKTVVATAVLGLISSTAYAGAGQSANTNNPHMNPC